jgi:hypothetical protein
MRRLIAATMAAGLMVGDLGSAVCAAAQAAAPFTPVAIPSPAPRSHRWAYITMAAGAALVGGSFYFSNRADQIYDDYQVETDPGRIEQLYDQTVRYDWLSRGTLLGGEALIASGLYLRFIRRPRGHAVGLELGSERCALAWRF